MCRCFRELRELRDTAQVLYPYLQRLSMGMSGDFEIAIEEGKDGYSRGADDIWFA